MPISFRPCNGSEGEMFLSRFCYRCNKLDEGGACNILLNSMIFEINEPEYPKELVCEDKLDPKTWNCTSFEEINVLSPPHSQRI